MRSLLFCPADSQKKLAKGFVSGADVVIVDLEDSVAFDNKRRARATARDFLADTRGDAAKVYVRVNDLGTGMTGNDLAAMMPVRPDGIMLPKCRGNADVDQLSAMLRVHELENGLDDGSTRILPIITETAAAVLAAASYRPHHRLAGLTWGAEDLSVALGARQARDDSGAYTDVFRLARSLTLLAAAAAETAATDTVYPSFRDSEGFRAECVASERDGFTAKMAIHPDQIAIIHDVFTPSMEAVERSASIIEAFAAAGNPGVVAIDGKMYDRPHLRLAERLLARARALGIAGD